MRPILETLVPANGGILGVAVLIMDLVELGDGVEGLDLILSGANFLRDCIDTEP
jgi:hypothetical protein